MSTWAETITYEFELQENVTPDDIRAEHPEDILIWVAGSGCGPGQSSGRYYICMDYKGHLKYKEAEVPGASTNAAMIVGLTDAVQRIKKPGRICVIPIAQLGIKAAFKGKGPNAERIGSLFQALKEKECSMTEILYQGGADEIKAFISDSNPQSSLATQRIEQEGKAKAATEEYRQKIYQECLEKVKLVLSANHVDSQIIQAVMNIKASS